MIERIDLQTVDLQSGAAAVINGAIPVAPFTIAGQEYRTSVPAPEARLDLVRSVNGWHFRLRADATVVGPCWRCLEDARVDIHADATETSEDGTSDPDLTSLYLDHGILDVAAWMRDAVVEELPGDPLPRGLRRPVPAVRRQPQHRPVRLRATAGPALVRSRRTRRSARRAGARGRDSGRRLKVSRGDLLTSRAGPHTTLDAHWLYRSERPHVNVVTRGVRPIRLMRPVSGAARTATRPSVRTASAGSAVSTAVARSWRSATSRPCRRVESRSHERGNNRRCPGRDGRRPRP